MGMSFSYAIISLYEINKSHNEKTNNKNIKIKYKKLTNTDEENISEKETISEKENISEKETIK